MNRENDLLPWILGGLSIATVVAAVTLGVNNRTAARNAPAPLEATAIPLPPAHVEPVATPVPAAAPPPAASVTPTAAPDATAAPPPPLNQSQPQTARIWQCVTNGQKTFSNNPCGAKSTVLDIGPVNSMEATPVFHAGRGYAAQPSYAPSSAPEYDSPQDDSYADSQGSANSSYPVYVGVPYAVRIKPQHRHPPFKHQNAPPARKY